MVLKEKAAAGQPSLFLSPDEEIFQFSNVKGAAASGLSYFPSIDIASLHLQKCPVLRDEEEESKNDFCYRVCGNIFPSFFFISLLVIYALLGAALFCIIEGRNNEKTVEFEAFLNKLWTYCESNKIGTEEDRKDNFTAATRQILQKEMKEEWLISAEEWTFLESLFFSCTVFTTVGYGHIYPRTRLGRIVCMLYALFGIPLMFLVFAGFGDMLAATISKIYNNYRNLHIPHITISYNRGISERSTDSDLVNRVSLHTEVKKSGHSINVQKDNRTIHQQLKGQRQNVELFEKIMGRDQKNTWRVIPPMERSISCPELENIKSFHSGHRSLREMGTVARSFDVPFLMIALVVFAYIAFGAAILPFWETHLNFETAFYFCFITFTTIGFGDITLHSTSLFLFCSVYVVVGMEIVYIAFKLLQKRLFQAYQTIIMYVTKWDITEPMEEQR